MARSDPVLIAGGGIGGLTLALALAHRGVSSHILERNPTFVEAGAGIQIGPNGIWVLRRLGLDDALAAHAAWPEAIEVRSASTGGTLARLPLGVWIAERHGAPYAVVHRAGLQAVLLEAARIESRIEITTGFRVQTIDDDGSRVIALSEHGDAIRGSVLVGADGLWSTVRRVLHPEPDLNFSGKTASRAVLPFDLIPAPFQDLVTRVWLAPGAHVVHYPVLAGTAHAIVVVLDGAWPGRGWGHETKPSDLITKVAGLAPPLIDLLRRAEDWRSWALYDPAPLPVWSKGRVTLLGDAAHPILPFLAQGGVMALEDAETLAEMIARLPGAPAEAFAAYERLRRRRVEQVQSASRRNGAVYHANGARALARDAALRLIPGKLLMSRYDWLYRPRDI